MERFCITLEQAKRLKELGFVGGSIHVWYEVDSADKGTLTFFNQIPTPFDHRPIKMWWAYSVGELGEMLKGEVSQIQFDPVLNDWEFQARRDEYLTFQTEAQARGALLLYLLESKLI